MRLLEGVALFKLVFQVPILGIVLAAVGEARAGKLRKASVRMQRWNALEGSWRELSHRLVHHGARVVSPRRAHLRAVSSFVRSIEEKVVSAKVVI